MSKKTPTTEDPKPSDAADLEPGNPADAGAEEGLEAQDFGEGFDEGWDDGAVASESAPAPSNPENDPKDPVEPGEEGQPTEKARSVADAGDGDDGGKEEPPSDPDGEGAVSESSQTQPKKADSSESDADAELARLRKALHDSESEIGRVRSFVKDRDAQIEALKKVVPKDEPNDEFHTPLSEEETAKVRKYEDEMDPDTGEIIDLKIREALTRERLRTETWQQQQERNQQELAAWRRQQEQERQEASVEAGVRQLDEKYGTGWREDFKDGRITAWVKSLPPNIGNTFQQILDTSAEPADAMYLLDQYYHVHPTRLPKESKSTEPKKEAPTKPKAEADPKVALRRQSQQRGANPAPRSASSDVSAQRSNGPWMQDADFNVGWEEGALSRV